MNNQMIPLPSVMPGREYIINHIKRGRSYADDLRGYGIFPGSRVKLLFNSPSGDPSAYEVMGAVLALRLEDSKDIYVCPATLHPQAHTCEAP